MEQVLDQDGVDSQVDMMPASFAFGLMGSMACGLAFWCGALLFII